MIPNQPTVLATIQVRGKTLSVRLDARTSLDDLRTLVEPMMRGQLAITIGACGVHWSFHQDPQATGGRRAPRNSPATSQG